MAVLTASKDINTASRWDLSADPEVSAEERARQIEIIAERLVTVAVKGGGRKPTACPGNVEIVLMEDPLFVKALVYDGFKNVVEWRGVPLTDADITAIRLAMGRTYRITPSVALMAEMLHYAAKQREFHPVRDYLVKLRWDGRHRLATMLKTYCAAPDTRLNAELGRRFMISAVARVMNPGCKVDTTLILAGPQGYFKSTFFRVLAGEGWFCDTPIDMRNKDAYLALRGAWLYEMAELSSMRPRDAETVKAFLAAQEDHFRPPYGREMVDAKRQCVFVGTTNETGFLNDPTGARRFWPVAVRAPIRLDEVRAAREQLWAEAVEAWRRGERWWLEEDGDEELRDIHQDYESEDPWETLISEWIDSQPPGSEVTIGGVLTVALKIDIGQQNRSHEMRVAGLLVRLGFKRRRITVRGKRGWVYDRPSQRQVSLL